MQKLTFVTGNQHKADKTAQLLGRDLLHEKVNLDELQTLNLAELAEHKVRQAYEHLQRPVIIDDFGLELEALGGLPGPFIKFFVEVEDGLEKLCRIVDSLGNRRANTHCVIAFYDGEVLKVFEKIMKGEIAQHPIGENGIQSDKIFMPEGYGMARAQLDNDRYDEVYKLVRPLEELKGFLNEYYG